MSAPESAPLEQLLGRVICEPGVRDRLAAQPEATLAELGVAAPDRQALLAHGVGRLLAYHHMVHTRLSRTVRAFVGRAAPLIGAEQLRSEVAAWIGSGGASTPYLREVPDAFLTWAAPRWRAAGTPAPWIVELARLEVLERQVRNDPAQLPERGDGTVALDEPVATNPTARVLRCAYAVHRLPRRVTAEHPPEPLPEGHAVVVYRRRDDEIRKLDIKPRSAHMLESLLAGASLRAALLAACEATGETLDDEILRVAALTLADLIDAEVLG